MNFGDTKDINTAAAGDVSNGATTKGVPYTMGAAVDNTPTYMAFRIFGVASTLVKESWTTADTVSGALTLSFTPRAVV